MGKKMRLQDISKGSAKKRKKMQNNSCGESYKYQLLHQEQFHAHVFNHSSKLLNIRIKYGDLCCLLFT